jgi:hypothetical protein
MSEQILARPLNALEKIQRDTKEFKPIIHNMGISAYQNALSKGYKITTIDDMLYLWYPELTNEPLISSIMSKIDAPVLSSTTGFYVANHGLNAFEQMINEATMTTLLPKEQYTYGGFRALTTAGNTSGEGQGENATLPDSTKPAALNVNVAIKEVAKTYDISSRQQFLSTTPNDVFNQPGGSALAALREYEGREFVKNMNRSLMGDANTVASDNLESIDRIAASNGEVGLVDANDLDIYGVDRDAGAGWTDATVLHNSGTDRPLTSDLILTLLSTVAKNWEGVNFRGDLNYSGVNNKVWITGWDTWAEVAKIYEGSNRYQDNGTKVRISMNGVQQYPVGSEVGMLANTLYGIPIFLTDDTVQDTISRLYLLDFDHLKLKVGIPIMNEEAGFSTGTSILLDRLGDRGLYYCAMELWADRFNCHGKIRDLL